MALPSSGVMKASMIQTELKETGSWSINAPTSRKLAGVPSGTIKFTDFYGKSSATFSSIHEWTQGVQTSSSGYSVTSTSCTIPYAGEKVLYIFMNSDKIVVHKHNRSGSQTDDAYHVDGQYNATAYRYYTTKQGGWQARTPVAPALVTAADVVQLKNNSQVYIKYNPSGLAENSPVLIQQLGKTSLENSTSTINLMIKKVSGRLELYVTHATTTVRRYYVMSNLNHEMRCVLSSSDIIYYIISGIIHIFAPHKMEVYNI